MLIIPVLANHDHMIIQKSF